METAKLRELVRTFIKEKPKSPSREQRMVILILQYVPYKALFLLEMDVFEELTKPSPFKRCYPSQVSFLLGSPEMV
jgi:hypothetical protein